MAAQGTPEFYHEQLIRLAMIAFEVDDPVSRLEILEIASSLKNLGALVRAEPSNNVVQFLRRKPQKDLA